MDDTKKNPQTTQKTNDEPMEDLTTQFPSVSTETAAETEDAVDGTPTPADEILDTESVAPDNAVREVEAEVVGVQNAPIEGGDSESVPPEYATPNAMISTDIEEQPTEIRHATPNAVSSLMNLESLINGFIVDMEKLQEKMKTQRDMFNDAFNNDAEFNQIMTKVKEINRVKSGAKQRLLKQPNILEVATKMREYKDELKDIQDGLSSYLQQYKELSGSNQITRDNGEVVEIVSITKLVKRRG